MEAKIFKHFTFSRIIFKIKMKIRYLIEPSLIPAATTFTEIPSGAVEKQTEVICSLVVRLPTKDALIVCSLILEECPSWPTLAMSPNVSLIFTTVNYKNIIKNYLIQINKFIYRKTAKLFTGNWISGRDLT